MDITLTVFVWKDEESGGQWLSQCQEIGWMTAGASPEEAVADTGQMITAWFRTNQKLGRLEQELARVTGNSAGLPPSIDGATALRVSLRVSMRKSDLSDWPWILRTNAGA